MNVDALEQDSVKFAESAVDCDTKGLINEAIFYYKEAAEALINAANAGSKLNCIEKAQEYYHRVEQLSQLLTQHQQKEKVIKNETAESVKRARIIVVDAFEEDEQNNKEQAIELYLEAADLCLSTMQQKDVASQLKYQLQKIAKQSMDRAEELKTEKNLASLSQLDNLLDFSKTKSVSTNTTSSNPSLPKKPVITNTKNKPSSYHAPNSSHSTSKNARSQGGGYTKEEIDVLRFTSLINGREYLPFIAADVQERFSFPVPYSDKHGMLELAKKQKDRLGGWMRPSELMADPQMIMAVSSMTIKQTIVSDCSFVASLAISASYERKFKKKLITSIIYPQNKKKDPIYNPCGKYMVKLHLNGVPRKVIIDDYLPVDKLGSLLCSYSANKNELWVSLVEKAYMKVMGGYDFPGSNSNIDLHALTGWIPERQGLRDKECDYNKFFEMLRSRFVKGDCLATISTGPMSDSEADRAGLVPSHAYAILDVRQVNAKRFLQLKNPWSHLRWKGRYSAQDEKNWTPSLKQALNYDNKFAQQHDNGVFWIDWESAMHFYDTVYISWNPDLFSKSTCFHAAWHAKDGPTKDSISLGNNPQYCLDVRSKQAAVVWVLLTRHITEKQDFAENKEFITLLVYKTDGKKVYYTYMPPPFIDGIRINSPHYLSKIPVQAGGEKFTLVVSQYEKHKNIRYTLRVYSICDVKFTKIPDVYKYKKNIVGKWDSSNAGGCANNRATYNLNPIYQINVKEKSKSMFLIEVRAPREYSVGFDVVCVESNSPETFQKTTSGTYRSGYSVMEIALYPGIYNLIPSTFSPQQFGAFFLDIGSNTQNFAVSKLK